MLSGGGQRSLEILKADGVDIGDRNAVIAECAKRINKSPGEWRKLAQCYGAVTKDNKIQLVVSKEEKGKYSAIPHKYEFMADAPFKVSAKCCKEMKKKIADAYKTRTKRNPITAQMAEESRTRTVRWLKNGCNTFGTRNAISNPMAFWTEQDVLRYIKRENLPMASVYGNIVYADENGNQYSEVIEPSLATLQTTGLSRTGCMFCGYGCQLEMGKGRFERMKETHPKQYEYIMKPWDEGGLGYKEVIDWINEHGNMNIKY